MAEVPEGAELVRAPGQLPWWIMAPGVVGCDTMNHWITESRGALEELLGRVGILVINDEEARLLSGERNVVRAARRLLAMGPRRVLIKRGEYGVIQFSANSVFAVPAFPLEEVFDPTGAGDTFAGGVMGHLAREKSAQSQINEIGGTQVFDDGKRQ
jgi:sugar/nucleoside kinase (ribokinase family)